MIVSLAQTQAAIDMDQNDRKRAAAEKLPSSTTRTNTPISAVRSIPLSLLMNYFHISFEYRVYSPLHNLKLPSKQTKDVCR